jgi:hypothetical protein
MVDFEIGAGDTIPGAGPSDKLGWPIAVPIATTSADLQLLGSDCVLMGWSLRDAFDGGGAGAEFYDGSSTGGVLLGCSRMLPSADAGRTDNQLAAQANGANAPLAPSIGGSAGTTAYVTGFQVTGLGATAATTVTVTLTGVLGGTVSYPLAIPAGVTTPITPLLVIFGGRGLQASAAGQAIALNVPAFGAGNTLAQAALQGSFLATLGAADTQWFGSGGIYVRTGLFLHPTSGSVKGAVWVRS